jgi:hypothetical protein
VTNVSMIDPPPAVTAWQAQSGACERGCPHVTDEGPMIGLLHAPGVLWCPACARAVAAARHGLQGNACDGCGQPTTRGIAWPGAPGLTVIGVLCQDCAQGEPDAQTTA